MQEQQFAEMIEHRRDALWREAVALLRNPIDAEDALQTACFKVWQRLYALQSEQKCVSYLRAAVHNECLSCLRERAQAPRPLRVPSDPAGVDGEGDAALLRRELLAHIAHLPPRYAQTLLLYYYQGYTQREIARLFSLPQGTVRARLTRARQMLRERLS